MKKRQINQNIKVKVQDQIRKMYENNFNNIQQEFIIMSKLNDNL